MNGIGKKLKKLGSNSEQAINSKISAHKFSRSERKSEHNEKHKTGHLEPHDSIKNAEKNQWDHMRQNVGQVYFAEPRFRGPIIGNQDTS